MTYNLTKADNMYSNAIFRNNLSNAPYQNELNKMWAVGSTESIYSYVNNHTSSYSPRSTFTSSIPCPISRASR